MSWTYNQERGKLCSLRGFEFPKETSRPRLSKSIKPSGSERASHLTSTRFNLQVHRVTNISFYEHIIVKMSPPLFKVEAGSASQEKATVNLLPCRIHHDGDASPSDTFWNPTKKEGESRRIRPRSTMSQIGTLTKT